MKNEVLGFLYALCAGISTSLGWFAVLCIKRAKPRVFTISMGLSAGVMIHVALIEMFPEALALVTPEIKKKAESEIWGAGGGYFIVSLSVFLGWGMCTATDWIVDYISACVSQRKINVESCSSFTQVEELRQIFDDIIEKEVKSDEALLVDNNVAEHSDYKNSKRCSVTFPPNCCQGLRDLKKSHLGNSCSTDYQMHSQTAQILEKLTHIQFPRDQVLHLRLGLVTAIMNMVHNIPEGIATWTSTVANPSKGLRLGIAIAFHNIIEGVAVAVSVYQATRSLSKAFIFTTLSGLAEPLGALAFWLLLGNKRNDLAMGIVISAVCGIMVCVGLQELYPAALRYDPLNRVASKSLVVGMLIMASTLVSFKFAD